MLAANWEAEERHSILMPYSTAEPLLLEALWGLGLRPELQQDVGRYIVDFLFREERLIVEVDGASHSPLRDHERDEEILSRHGLRTIRVPAKALLDGKAEEWAEDVRSHVVAAQARRDAA